MSVSGVGQAERFLLGCAFMAPGQGACYSFLHRKSYWFPETSIESGVRIGKNTRAGSFRCNVTG